MMDEQTNINKAWLDRRYSRKNDGQYYAHQPIFGWQSDQSEPNPVQRLARTYQITKVLNSLSFDSFLDVGGAEGYISAIVRDLFDASIVHTSDLSAEACLRAREIFNIQSVANNAERLPFFDDSYDVVFCSEVIEHLIHPVFAISELVRVARKYVIITTQEFCPLSELERMLRLLCLRVEYPHDERNWFTEQDFQTTLSDEISLCSQMYSLGGRIEHFFFNLELSEEQLEKALDFLTTTHSLDVNHIGVIVIVPQSEAELDFNVSDIDSLNTIRKRQIFDRLLKTYPVFFDDKRMAPDKSLVERLVCLVCQSRLDFIEGQLTCRNCGQTYQIKNGVPLMFPPSPEAQSPTNLGKDAVAILSQNDVERTQKIETLMAKLHGKRPLSTPLVARIAFQLLRVMFFFQRPETIGMKFNRVCRRLKKQTPVDYDTIQEVLFSDE